MKKLLFESWIIEVDVQKTSDFYKYHNPDEDCRCKYCMNFRSNIEISDDGIRAFCNELGIDPLKSGEIMEFGLNDEGEIHYSGFYHIVGRIISGPTKIIDKWNDIKLLEINKYKFGFSNEDISCVSDRFPEPTMQLEFETHMPWILEEEYNE